MVKTIVASQGHEADAEKSQNHFVHCSNGERTDNDNTLIDVFRWSRCKMPLPQKVMRSIGIPLPSEHVEVLFSSFLSIPFLLHIHHLLRSLHCGVVELRHLLFPFVGVKMW